MSRWIIPVLLTGCFSKWEAIDVDGDGRTAADGDCWDFPNDPIPPDGALNHGVTAADIYVGAEDLPYDGIDANCDGLDDFDHDGDGFVPSEFTGIQTLTLETSGALLGGDCWDTPDEEAIHSALGTLDFTADMVHPDADDVYYDGIDSNCDDADDFDQDLDGFVSDAYDGYETLFSTETTHLPSGDCWDNTDEIFEDPTGSFSPSDVHPSQTEIYYDGADINCDAASDCDMDGDGFDVDVDYCVNLVPAEARLDCNDGAPDIFPNGNPEIYYNGIDDNCDTRDGDGDQDGDGFWATDYPFTSETVDVSVTVPDILDDCWDDPSTTPSEFSVINGFDPLTASDVNTASPDRFYDGVQQDCGNESDFDKDGDGFDSLFYPQRDGNFGDDCVDSVDDPDFVNVGIQPVDVFPGNNTETYYDGVDQNCDGLSDYDQDEDGQDSNGFGGTDCDDSNEFIYLDATLAEPVNDGVDQNCDAMEACYIDADLDGFGNSLGTTGLSNSLSCTGEIGFSATMDDCADNDDTVSPTATEICDGQVNSCGGSLPTNEVDDDGDGYVECTIDSNGWDGVTISGGDDCDDSDAFYNPATTWFADTDNDNFGDATNTTASCTQPTSYLLDNTDCDDSDSTTFPFATEICDGQINACGGSLPLNEIDNDNDGYVECTIDSNGWDGLSVSGGDDCDDTDITISPTASEICDGQVNTCGGGLPLNEVDNDNDGYVECTIDLNGWDGVNITGGDDCDDTDAFFNPATMWYADTDNDGFGNIATSTSSCTQPTGYTLDTSDCNDGDDTIYPSATELCDGQVNACGSGLPPDEIDNDGDGYVECTIDTNGWDGFGQMLGGDCVDTNANINPSTVWYADTDNDTFGNASNSQTVCQQPTGYISDNTDCDDTDGTIYPNAQELCDGQVNTCGSTLPNNEVDDDGDGYVECPIDSNGWDGVAISGGDDCDDDSAFFNPATVWFADVDNDTFGDATNTTASCTQPTNYLLDDTDCDDNDPNAYVGATEIIDDGIDQDCDGADATGITADELTFGDLIITEFMADGYKGGGNDEWFEVYNNTNQDIDPFGLQIADANNIITIGDHFLIPANSYFVFVNNENPVDNGNFDWQNIPHYEYPSIGFNDNGDDITLLWDDGNSDIIISSITYANASPNFHYAEGLSSIVDDHTVTNNDNDVLWCSSATLYHTDGNNEYYGTPGSTNDNCDGDGDGFFNTIDGSEDCNDGDANINPAAVEIIADGTDQDCDGFEECYIDNDNDGDGNSSGLTDVSSNLNCSTTGLSTNTDDCDDNDLSVFLGATEIPADGIDQNCDGLEECYVDGDNDGYGKDTGAIGTSSDFTCTSSNFADNMLDCDDGSNSIHPYATEDAGSIDHNCDGFENLSAPIDDCVGDIVQHPTTGVETYILVCSTTENWSTALNVCLNAGITYNGLPKVTNQFLNDELEAVLNTGNLWLGLNDSQNEGTFEWSDGSAYIQGSDYANWKNGFNSNQNAGEDCIRMNNSTQWEDKSCDDSNKIACMYEF